MPPVVATPNILVDPGFLWVAPLGTAAPTNTVAASKFTDTVAAAWLPLGATTEGSTFSYSTSVEAINVAEFFDPIKYVTTERSGNIAFALADFTLTNYRRALNGGVAAIAPTGTAGAELATLEPPDPGSEVRCMVLWESTDATVRLMLRQTIQGGEVSVQMQKAPSYASIPCTFNMETPLGAAKPWIMWSAGVDRAA